MRSTSACRRRACSTRSRGSIRFSTIRGPEANVAPPDPALLASPAVRSARNSVFRVTGSACGLGVSGSGWAAAPNLVVTNAHVVAGMKDPRVDRRDGEYLDAVVVAFDVRDDIAVLRVPGLGARPLEPVAPVAGRAVAILGYPESGPFAAAAGRIGQTSTVLTEDAYGRGPVNRRITTLRGDIRHGNSGGPAVDIRGHVQTTVFASRSVSRARDTACRRSSSRRSWQTGVAGMKDPRVDRRDGDYHDADVVAFNVHDDIAVLRVAGLGAVPLETATPVEGQSVAILGYPENGPFTATPGRIGETRVVLAEDAHGRGPVNRKITTLRGRVRHGNSGGPAVDNRGRVRTTVFAARVGADNQGYGVPTEHRPVDPGRGARSGSVSTGPCVG